jgi:TonB family protein
MAAIVLLAVGLRAVQARQSRGQAAKQPAPAASCKGLRDCGIVEAVLICGPAPELPRVARDAHIRGRVTLTAIVEEHGLVETLGLLSGHPFLVAAAFAAAKDYRFKPATARGVPISSQQVLVIRFRDPETDDAGGPAIPLPCIGGAPRAKPR